MSVEFRGETHVEDESESGILYVEVLVAFRHRISQHRELVFLHVIVQRVADGLVDHVVFHGGSVFLLDESGGGVSGTEAWLSVRFGDVFELLLHLVGVVCFFERNGYATVHVVESVEFYVHYLFR